MRISEVWSESQNRSKCSTRNLLVMVRGARHFIVLAVAGKTRNSGIGQNGGGSSRGLKSNTPEWLLQNGYWVILVQLRAFYLSHMSVLGKLNNLSHDREGGLGERKD